MNADCLLVGDFELMATAIGHQYIAIQYDRILPEEEWRMGEPSIGEEAKNVSRMMELKKLQLKIVNDTVIYRVR